MAYKAFNGLGEPTPHCDDDMRAKHEAMIDKNGGWIEDEAGKVIYGRKRVGTIDFTPSWQGCLPLLIAGLTEGNDKGKTIAREELQRMAEAADAWNAYCKKSDEPTN